MVWRRLLVPGGVRLPRLHGMFQAVMGWTDSHLHQFRINDSIYGMQGDDYPDDELDEASVTVIGALRGVRRFFYDYDFGDDWNHEVVVEDLTTTTLGLKHGVCLDGQRACPARTWVGRPAMKNSWPCWPTPPMTSTSISWLGRVVSSTRRPSAWSRPTSPCSGCAEPQLRRRPLVVFSR